MITRLGTTNAGVGDLTVPVAERLTLLTGENATGKTFVLDCLWRAVSGEWPVETNAAVGRGYPPTVREHDRRAAPGRGDRTARGRRLLRARAGRGREGMGADGRAPRRPGVLRDGRRGDRVLAGRRRPAGAPDGARGRADSQRQRRGLAGNRTAARGVAAARVEPRRNE